MKLFPEAMMMFLVLVGATAATATATTTASASPSKRTNTIRGLRGSGGSVSGGSVVKGSDGSSNTATDSSSSSDVCSAYTRKAWKICTSYCTLGESISYEDYVEFQTLSSSTNTLPCVNDESEITFESESPSSTPTTAPTTNAPTASPTTAPTAGPTSAAVSGKATFYPGTYSVCAEFLADLESDAFFTEDFTDDGYQSGDREDLSGCDHFTSDGMTSVRNEITYLASWNLVLISKPDADYLYCAGDDCGELPGFDFTQATSYNTSDGVQSVCFDFNYLYNMKIKITFEDDTTEEYDIDGASNNNPLEGYVLGIESTNNEYGIKMIEFDTQDVDHSNDHWAIFNTIQFTTSPV